MSSIIGIFAIGLMIVVLAIAIFSLVVLVIIPIGKYVEKKQQQSQAD